jgi:hypothetical protein
MRLLDISYFIGVTIYEFILGHSILVNGICPICFGKGIFPIDASLFATCPTCFGTG